MDIRLTLRCLRRIARFARGRPLSPDVVLDVTTDDSPLDLVARRFDAGQDA